MRRVDRQLDAADLELLKTLAVQGEMNPKESDAQRRLDRLELEGYAASVRNDPPQSSAPPAWFYRLTAKGESVVNP